MAAQYNQNQPAAYTIAEAPKRRAESRVNDSRVFELEYPTFIDARTDQPVDMEMNFVTGLMEKLKDN